MLEYTGHPLLDVGVATVTAFAGKQNPADLTENDLSRIADYIAREYVKQPLKSFFTVAFTSNAWFSQYAYNPGVPGLSDEKREKRREKRSRLAHYHLEQWSPEADRSEVNQGVFTGTPAIEVALSGKLPIGRAGRAQVPLALGDKYINFYTNGYPGLPVSGKALLCLQAFPLGCAKCSGRLLIAHSDNNELTLYFARMFLQENRKRIHLAREAGSKKMPEPHYKHKTLLVDTLLKARSMQQVAREDEQLFSLTAYHLSNSGQGPKLDIYHLPLEILGFLRDMYTAKYKMEWEAIVRQAWEVAPKKKKSEDFQPQRNWLYEDLFTLPEAAPRFLRTYFLRVALQRAHGKTDPRVNYSLRDEAHLVSWKITARFLRRIMNMDKERIAEIRKMGDRLAKYVSGQNDRRFFHNFLTARRYGDLRAILVKANLAHVRNGHAPIITLDPYVQVFEEGDEVAYANWRLARDLVLIRMVEQLYEQGWLGGNIDAIPESEEEAQEKSDI